MPMKHEVAELKDGVRVTVEGDVDMQVAVELRSVLKKALEGKPKLLVVDLGKVPFIDSSGIATIIEALKIAQRQMGALRVENCQPDVRDTFDIAGITQILGIT